MGAPLERRHSGGRRISDSRDTRELRGLLHDLGHEMSTLSFLVEAVRGDVRLPDDSSYRLELLSLEMTRLLDIIRHGLNTATTGDEAEVVKVRDVVAELTRLAQLAYPAEVELLPGPAATAYLSPVLLWRVLSNVVDNAARAAGAGGRVTLAVRRERATVVDVADTGPGFGSVPKGQASLGLDVVMSLLDNCGGGLEVISPPGGGTTVRVTLPSEVPAQRQAREHAGPVTT
jgi:signal transduction histidine kinase